MDYLIAQHGTPAKKIVNSVAQFVIPFVGGDFEGQMGFGLVYPNGQVEDFHAIFAPRRLLRTWRAMKLLEQVTDVNSTTLSRCWVVMQPYVHENDWHSGEPLIDVVGGNKKLESIRTTLLSSVPSVAEFKMMATCFREKNIFVDGSELETAVNKGIMEMTPEVQAIINETRERNKVYECVKKKTDHTSFHEVSTVLPRQGLFNRFAALFRG